MKWVIGLIILVVVAAGVAWKMGWLHAPAPVTASQTATSTGEQSQQIQSGLPTAQSDTSDAAISQDAAAIDTQINGMNQDSAAVDSSLNDQQTTQSF